jgi:hypothetical protein
MAAAASTFAAAIFTFRFASSACAISRSSTGSPYCFHHSASAVSATCAASKRKAAGASIGGRT